MREEIPLKTSIEVARQRKPCGIASQVLRDVRGIISPGTTTAEINRECERLTRDLEGVGALKGYRGYQFATCTSVNHVAAHGVPGNHALQDGDVLTIDVVVERDGWYGDSAWTYLVGKSEPESKRLVRAAWSATIAGIKAAKAGGRLGDIGAAIEETARRFGCSVLDNLVGHGIGRDMHEEPMILNTGIRENGLPIVPGMVFTIEPILCLGKASVHRLADGWSIVTKDGSKCAQYEQTVAIFGDRTEILTLADPQNSLTLDFPPFI